MIGNMSNICPMTSDPSEQIMVPPIPRPPPSGPRRFILGVSTISSAPLQFIAFPFGGHRRPPAIFWHALPPFCCWALLKSLRQYGEGVKTNRKRKKNSKLEKQCRRRGGSGGAEPHRLSRSWGANKVILDTQNAILGDLGRLKVPCEGFLRGSWGGSWGLWAVSWEVFGTQDAEDDPQMAPQDDPKSIKNRSLQKIHKLCFVIPHPHKKG